MKSTIKLNTATAFNVYPCKTGGVVVEIEHRNGQAKSLDPYHLTPDQIGALLFGIESAAEAARIAQDRATATA